MWYCEHGYCLSITSYIVHHTVIFLCYLIKTVWFFKSIFMMQYILCPSTVYMNFLVNGIRYRCIQCLGLCLNSLNFSSIAVEYVKKNLTCYLVKKYGLFWWYFMFYILKTLLTPLVWLILWWFWKICLICTCIIHVYFCCIWIID